MVSPVRVAPVALLVALAACSSTGCDPTRAGFLEGINCANGGYQQRELVLNQGLAQAQANELEQKAQAAEAANAATTAQAQLAARQRQMAGLDAKLGNLRQKLKAAAARQGADSDAIRRISVQMADLSRQQDAARHDPLEANMRAIEDRQRQIVKMLNDLN
jgi:hypothetical protein